MTTPDIPAGQDLDVLAGQPIDAVDVENLSRVATMFSALDPVPPDLVERLQFAISLDALNAELAELHQLDELAMSARTEQSGAVRTLTFNSDSATTMITVSDDGPERVRIDGWCAPGAGATIELRQVGASAEVAADEDGRFVFADVAHGLTRFVIRLADSDRNSIVTPAVEL